MDSNIVTKLISLKFGDKERTMFYLFLTTHNETGALALNKILSDAKYLEYELRYRLKFAKKTAPPPGQMTLWASSLDGMEVPQPEKTPRPSNEKIGEYIMQKFSGREATKKDVYKKLANTLYFPNEIDKALRYLRRVESACFDGNLRHDTVIRFVTKE